MAAAEARALLDQLMGGDRNAPLPKGAALPPKRKDRGAGGDNALLLPGKRHKSCYDKDVCPLYCAWGVDVYELFVNTKSDIGPNPYTSDDAARKEYLSLPQHEKDRLGFEHMLFNKLGELVQQCDRTVTRNQEKLNKELQRQLQKRGGQDYVVDVDEAAVEQLCRNQIMVEELTAEVVDLLDRLKVAKDKEEVMSKEMKEKADRKKEKEEEQEQENGSEPIKKEEQDETNEKSDIKKEEENPAGESSSDQKSSESDVPMKDENDEDNEDNVPKKEDSNAADASKKPFSDSLALELGKVMMERQAILCDISRKLAQLGPLQESVETQSRNLNHVKSDTTTDKTVCDVSGNFMSARDADERIAAHYAGKQYVGWKLVREKFKEMLSKHGKYGPPPPGRGGPPPMDGGPPLQSYRGGPPGGRGGGYGGGGDNWGGNRHHDGYRGGRNDRRGGGRGRRSPSPSRWERGGGGGGYDRGYDNRRGGGGGGRYDQGRRGHHGSGRDWGRR